jgi:hypothetical protein
MLGLVGLGVLLGRPSHGPLVLAAVTTAMLVFRPAWALDPGFQLSVVAMAVIVAGRRGLLAQSWRISWALAPLCLLHFGDAPLWGVVANLLAIPVISLWVIPLGVVGWLLAPYLGPTAVAPASWGAELVIDVAAVAARLPAMPEAVIAGLALFFLTARFLPWPRSLWRTVSPPVLACVGIIAVVSWMPRPRAPAPGTTFVVGSVRSHGVIAVAARGTCIYGPRIPGRRLARLVEALGIDGVREVRAVETPSAHAEEARAALVRKQRFRPAEEACVAPEATRLEPALRRCLRRTGNRLAIVRSTAAGPRRVVHCFARGEWVPLVL